ncbi:MAG: fused MFS/spermidine synthase, partial [Candidatus Omnitrophota bacterium]|nr:fused MFS/spermidine synthase [Candidatus Omnitrophota bacterium]
TLKICYSNLIKYPRAFLISILVILFIAPFIDSEWCISNYVYEHRNYYGIYKVYKENGAYLLMNGTTIHGLQFKDKERENLPVSYYHKLTPVGELLGSSKISFKNIGIIGLGTGGLAAYAQGDQVIDYFEIDPDVYFISQNLFTYTKNSKGKINFNFGDARIKIKETANSRYDILIVDAFSGDSIPVHLLTTEAIEEYRKHLKSSGLILFHISNRYLDFVPVLFSNANYVNAYGCYKDNKEGKKDYSLFGSSWFALSWDGNLFNKLVGEYSWIKYNPGKDRLIRPWTDKYSDMISIISLNDLFGPLKNFKPFYW